MEVLVKESSKEKAIIKFHKLFPHNSIEKVYLKGLDNGLKVYEIYYSQENKGVVGSIIGLSQGSRKLRDKSKNAFRSIGCEFKQWGTRVI